MLPNAMSVKNSATDATSAILQSLTRATLPPLVDGADSAGRRGLKRRAAAPADAS
jgi:hypothetical protein